MLVWMVTVAVAGAVGETLRVDGAKVQVTPAEAKTVDVYGAFDRTGDEKTQLCNLTLFCGAIHDLHPTDLGYRTIGALLSAAARR